MLLFVGLVVLRAALGLAWEGIVAVRNIGVELLDGIPMLPPIVAHWLVTMAVVAVLTFGAIWPAGELLWYRIARKRGIPAGTPTVFTCPFRRQPSGAHGTAQWLKPREIRRCFAIDPDEPHFTIGRCEGFPAGVSGEEQDKNILIVAPAGSGKTQSQIVANVLEEMGKRSLVMTDPKGEVFAKTYRYIASVYGPENVWVLDLTPGGAAISNGWNPRATHSIGRDGEREADIQACDLFGEIWTSNTGTSSSNPFYHQVEQQIMSTAALPRLCRRGLIQSRRENDLVEKGYSSLAIKSRSPADSILDLSGGNQQKVLLARWLATDPQLLLLDEPTRGIDVGTKTEIHRLISAQADRGRAVLLISSELPELLALADRIYVLYQGRVVAELPGGPESEEAVITATMGGDQT
jgi:energy-coupling factor transporter ATP-binding protein EcfA2